MKNTLSLCGAWFAFAWSLTSQAAPEITFTPDVAGGVYASGAKAGWTLRRTPADEPTALRYTILRDGGESVQSGELAWRDGAARVEATVEGSAMLRVDVSFASGGEPLARAGAAVAPAGIAADEAAPADFDAFWSAKLAALRAVPMAPALKPGESGREGVEYATLTLANIRGAKIHGQIARPARDGKFPAILLLQWAGGPYPLQKSWVVDRAAEGWLALNVMPHDVPGDMPKEFYDALPRLLKDYGSIGDTDRERSYFLGMYLGACRAADYLTTRPDWDGKILVASGASMGGMQAVVVAALEPRVTHLIAHTPAGCDALAAKHGRGASYPNWNVSDARVAATAPYFDLVNFALCIRVPSLVSMGFIDTVTQPTGIWMAFNRIAGPKEAAPMVEAPHGHQAKPGQEKPFNDRRDAWLAALVAGREPEVRAAGR